MSLVSSYAVCFLQQGGMSLASSAIIYNIVKVKVSRWTVDPFDSLSRRPVDLFEKEPFKGNCEVHLHRPLRCEPSTRLTRRPSTRLTHWPVDPSTRWPFRKRTPQGPPIYTVEMPSRSTYIHCWDAVQYPSSKRCRIRLLLLQARGAVAACGMRLVHI